MALVTPDTHESKERAALSARVDAARMFVLAALWFVPTIWWGLPESTQEYVRSFWAIDEVGPKGSLNVILKLLGEDTFVTPQYPLAHYFVQALLVWPYHLAVLLADNVGLPKQTDSLTVLALLHRLPSVFMSAGTVLAAAVVAKRMSGSDSARWPTAIAVATIGPLVYYARTSNVDAGALFWAIAALVPTVDAILDRLTTRRAVLLALCAAAGVATKDQQYAYFAGLALVLSAHHLTRRDVALAGMAKMRPLFIAAGLTVALYAVLSGALLMPSFFAEHVAFIRAGSSADVPQELRRLIGTYFENTATLAGYSQLAVDIATLLVSAVGIPVCLLAVGGVVALYRRSGWLLAVLLMPVVVLFIGVIIPVRFVLPRFLLPVDVVLCILAGIGFAAAVALPRWRVMATATLAAAIGWGVVRGADLTWQMHRDVRYEVASWLDRNLQPGDTLAHYGARLKLPRLRRDIEVTLAPDQYLPDIVYGERGPATQTPQFLIVIPQQMAEREHEWSLPDSVYRQLLDGSRGYEQVLAVQTPALFPRHRRSAPAVNSPVRIFARRDMVSRLVDTKRLDVAVPTPADR